MQRNKRRAATLTRRNRPPLIHAPILTPTTDSPLTPTLRTHQSFQAPPDGRWLLKVAAGAGRGCGVDGVSRRYGEVLRALVCRAGCGAAGRPVGGGGSGQWWETGLMWRGGGVEGGGGGKTGGGGGGGSGQWWETGLMWRAGDLEAADGSKTEQVEGLVLRRIERGELSIGSRLPSERVLAERLGVSRVTVVRALENLRRDGVLETKRGAGAGGRAVGRLLGPGGPGPAVSPGRSGGAGGSRGAGREQ